MARVFVNDSTLTDIADAIREKNGTEDTYKPSQMADAVKGIQSGGDSYYDEFWDEFQQNGALTDYSYSFNSVGWTDNSLKPKYTIKPIKATNMFSNGCKITVVNDEKFDFSECIQATDLFYLNSKIREVNINITNITNFNGAFYYCGHLKDVTLRNINSECSFLNAFYICSSLVNFNMTGTIGKSISFVNSALLSDASIQSIIDGLADLTGSTAQTLTFHADVKAKLTESQISQITSKNWTLA